MINRLYLVVLWAFSFVLWAFSFVLWEFWFVLWEFSLVLWEFSFVLWEFSFVLWASCLCCGLFDFDVRFCYRCNQFVIAVSNLLLLWQLWATVQIVFTKNFTKCSIPKQIFQRNLKVLTFDSNGLQIYLRPGKVPFATVPNIRRLTEWVINIKCQFQKKIYCWKIRLLVRGLLPKNSNSVYNRVTHLRNPCIINGDTLCRKVSLETIRLRISFKGQVLVVSGFQHYSCLPPWSIKEQHCVDH